MNHLGEILTGDRTYFPTPVAYANDRTPIIPSQILARPLPIDVASGLGFATRDPGIYDPGLTTRDPGIYVDPVPPVFKTTVYGQAPAETEPKKRHEPFFLWLVGGIVISILIWNMGSGPSGRVRR